MFGLLRYAQGGQVCRLKDLQANEDIIVATTHLKVILIISFC